METGLSDVTGGQSAEEGTPSCAVCAQPRHLGCAGSVALFRVEGLTLWCSSPHLCLERAFAVPRLHTPQSAHAPNATKASGAPGVSALLDFCLPASASFGPGIFGSSLSCRCS